MRILSNRASRIFMSLVMVVGLMPTAAFAAENDDSATAETFTAKQFDEAELQAQHDQIEEEGRQEAYAEGEVLVIYEENVPETLTASSIDSLEVSNVESVVDDMPGEGGETVLVRLDEGQSVADAVIAVEQQPGVAYAQPNYRYTLIDDIEEEGETTDNVSTADESGVYGTESTSVNDPIANVSTDTGPYGTKNQWWLYSVNAFDAWSYAKCENSVTVAIIDSGINFDHVDLKDQIDTEHAWDAAEDKKLTENPSEDFSHGSHVAGIVAGTANNGTGIAGVSYNAKILPIQVFETVDTALGTEIGAYDDTLIAAFDYLLDLKSKGELDDLHVINMSLGGYGNENTAVKNIIAEAKKAGIVTVCSGGNGDGKDNAYTLPQYPSDYEDCISVMALKSDDTRAKWSDYNSDKDIIAPGVDIWSTWYTGDEYACLSGTSMASPLVAGICALLYSVNPDLTVDEVKEALYNTATDLGDEGYDVYYGWGKVNAYAAVRYIARAKVTSDEAEIFRTESMQMTATPLNSATKVDSWTWSVDNPEVATIDANGVLTGITAGTVKVTAVASNDSEVFGSRKITVSEIEIPGSLEASDKDVSGVELSWSATRAAKGYEVSRASHEDGDYEVVADVSATTSDSVTYNDTSAEANTVYYYKVQPYGMLDSTRVDGIQTEAARGMYRNAITSIAGEGRYETNGMATSLYAANATYSGEEASTVIVASGKNYPDALSASSLAGVLGAPIVLTNPDVLEEATGDQIVNMMPRNIFIVGGTAAVSEDVEAELAEVMPEATVTRISGATRVKTAEKVYDAGNGDWGSTAIVATSANYADALSISPYAYATKSPILLAESDGTLSTVTRQRLKAGGFTRVVIVGGESAVPAKAEKTIKSLGIDCERWSGSSRIDTSAVIAQHAVDEGVLTWENAGFATAWGFPDALSAGTLQGQLGGVLMLVDGSSECRDILDDNIAENSKQIDHITFYGGTGVVSQSVRDYIAKAADVD